jgi:iron only hydrogenase large subunit-like protein
MEQKNIEQQTEDGTTKEDSKIVDSRSLNDMIEKYIKNKD